MSKKVRKKSSAATSTSTVAKGSRSTSKMSASATAAKPRKTAAKKTKPAATASSKTSHKADSKPLKSSASAPQAAGGLIEGAKAPAFRLPRDGGGELALADHAGRKLVLFFYPRADTPGCTKEAIDFTRLRDEFAAVGAEVVGISADPVKAQDSFRNKHQLRVPLLSDEQHQALQTYGAWGEKSMYGRTFLGVLRTTVLIDASGRIARIWRNVRVDGHAEQVLEAAKQL